MWEGRERGENRPGIQISICLLGAGSEEELGDPGTYAMVKFLHPALSEEYF